MRVYYVENEVDFESLLIHLEGLGYKYIYGQEFSISRPYVIVWATDMIMYSYQELVGHEMFNFLPIINYKSEIKEGDKGLNFTKQNIERAFSKFVQGEDSISELKERIINLVESPKHLEEPTISERSAISVDNKDIYALQWKDVLSTENVSNHGLFKSVEEAIKSIRMWWELNDYTSPYIRYWESKPGTTKIDYGSHRYFYYITKVDKDNFQSVIYQKPLK